MGKNLKVKTIPAASERTQTKRRDRVGDATRAAIPADSYHVEPETPWHPGTPRPFRPQFNFGLKAPAPRTPESPNNFTKRGNGLPSLKAFAKVHCVKG